MTTHDRDKIIAAAKEADSGFTGDESFNLGTSLVGLEAIERFYAIAFEAGCQAERLECAKVCDSRENMHRQNYGGYIGQDSTIAEAKCCADAIRARGDTK